MARKTTPVAQFLHGKLPRRNKRIDTVFVAQQLGRLGRRDTIRLAMATEHKVGWTYTRKTDGHTSKYVARPYSVRRGRGSNGEDFLYAQDNKHGDKIHAFITTRIKNAKMKPRATYQPTWRVEPHTI